MARRSQPRSAPAAPNDVRSLELVFSRACAPLGGDDGKGLKGGAAKAPEAVFLLSSLLFSSGCCSPPVTQLSLLPPPSLLRQVPPTPTRPLQPPTQPLPPDGAAPRPRLSPSQPFSSFSAKARQRRAADAASPPPLLTTTRQRRPRREQERARARGAKREREEREAKREDVGRHQERDAEQARAGQAQVRPHQLARSLLCPHAVQPRLLPAVRLPPAARPRHAAGRRAGATANGREGKGSEGKGKGRKTSRLCPPCRARSGGWRGCRPLCLRCVGLPRAGARRETRAGGRRSGENVLSLRFLPPFRALRCMAALRTLACCGKPRVGCMPPRAATCAFFAPRL